MERWRKRIGYLTIICLSIIVIAQVVQFVQTKTFNSDVISTIGTQVTKFINYFKNLSQVNKTNSILLLIFVAIFLVCVRKNKIKGFVFTVVTFLITSPLYIKPLEALYVKFSYEISFIAICIIAFVISYMILYKKGKELLKFLLYSIEMAIITTIVYCLLTSKSFVIWQVTQQIWYEVRNSFKLLEPYTNVIAILYLSVVFVLIYFSLIRSIIFNLRNQKSVIQIKYEDLKGVTICIPAYREVNVIIDTIRGALSTIYPKGKKEVLIICDGSDDGTYQKVLKTFDMLPVIGSSPTYNFRETAKFKSLYVSKDYPELKLLIKENGGKHDALNMGLKYSSKDTDYIVNLDADTKLSQYSLMILSNKMGESNASAVAGFVKPVFTAGKRKSVFSLFRNSVAKILVTLQQIDYSSAFHISRGGLALFNAQLIVSGAFGLFDKRMLLNLYGYDKSLGEDMNLTLKIHTKKGKIVFVPQAIAYTAAPTTFRALSTQRRRWFKGLLECLYTFKYLLFSRLWYAYLEYFIIEVSTSLMIPIGILMILANPVMIQNSIFQIIICFTILTAMLLSLAGLLIENRYRKVKLKTFLCIPLQLVFFVLTFLWKTDGILELKNKSWGNIIKKYKN